MTWGASGRVLHPRTGQVVTSQPIVTAYRVDTGVAHPFSAQADTNGVVTFVDLVDDVEYIALADLGLPAKVVVPLIYQLNTRATRQTTGIGTAVVFEPNTPSENVIIRTSGGGKVYITPKGSGGSVVIDPESGDIDLRTNAPEQHVLLTPQGTRASVILRPQGAGGAVIARAGNQDQTVAGAQAVGATPVDVLSTASGAIFVEGAYLTSASATGSIPVTALSIGGDIAIVSASSSVWNLRRTVSLIDVRRVSGSATLSILLIIRTLR